MGNNNIRHSEYAKMLMQNKKTLQRLCIGMAKGDAELAKDSMQEVMMSLWTNFDTIKATDSTLQRLKVYWIARGIISNYLRTRQHRIATVAVDNNYPSEENHARETLEDVAKTLDDSNRNLLELILDGYNTKEIAAKLDISINAVYKRRTNLINKMRKKIVNE